MPVKKKLIEVALPLDAINAAAAREKSIRHGHPSTLHLWWARRPLAAARAVIWASLVDDPSAHPEKFPTINEQETERQRLFQILKELVVWKNSNDKRVLENAKAEIKKSLGDGELPPLLDPFAGGGCYPAGSSAFGSESLCPGFKPGSGHYQQSHDRDSAVVCREIPRQSGGARPCKWGFLGG
ncbi:DUF1156 domain-containing protein [Mobiluncus mulieris]|uniref:DUF1156 domain-containing protein n=1 Tax=Mobiluncus mulieris TaxID=2052 RepID=UPI00242AFEA9|nr:DUF1156 domain-containing protein [Mobiluncus mulieris]